MSARDGSRLHDGDGCGPTARAVPSPHERDVRMCGFARRTRVADALLILEERITRLDSELVPVTEAAGRVAASDLHARVAVPHFRRSMMDGYAVVAESTFGGSELAPRPLLVVGEVRAGEKSPLERSLVLGEALRITTGAVLPPGADAVVMAELTLELDPTHIGVTQAVSPHKHVGAIGEDVAAGAVVVSAGRLLRPQDAGLLASVGIAMVPVIRRPRVAVIVTGNELLAPGAVPEGACIVDSNSVVLAALAQRDGAIVASIERILDDRDTLRSALERTRADVVLLSGGSSVGPEDHAPAAVRELGELAVHGVAMRPSSPAGFGFLPNSRPIFLLPGNPVSSLCAYEFFAGPTIRALGGRRRSWPHRVREARLATKLVSELGRTDYARVRFDAEGRVVPLMTSGASILSSTTLADGVVIVPDDREGYDEGELVVVSLYDDAP